MECVLVIFNDKIPNESILRKGGVMLVFGLRVHPPWQEGVALRSRATDHIEL